MLIKADRAAGSIGFTQWNLNPYQILTLGFTSAILLGTFLLMLPAASQTGASLPFIDALFTATSAVCVTGLTVVSTGDYFSVFGQMVIILLIQVGGLGVMTLTTLIAVLMGRKINLSKRLLVQESFNQLTMEGMVHLVLYVVKVTLLLEFLGGTILALRFWGDYGWRGVYYGYWHATSAFCNAGFDLFGGDNLFRYATDPLIVLTLSGLIILGGLGFAVLEDVFEHRSWERLAEQSKIVLAMSAFLLLFGMVVLFLLEYHNPDTIGDMSFSGKLLASFFESATARTAGYTMIDNGALTEASLFLVIWLMFIGASPASTGGGIKTSTFAVIVATVWGLIRGRDEVLLFSREVPKETIIRALTLFFLAAGLVFFVTMYLCVTEDISVIRAAFEVVSAFATVGLTTGITPSLTSDGKFILVLVMLLGRVGVVTVAMALAMRKNARHHYHYPTGKFTIG